MWTEARRRSGGRGAHGRADFLLDHPAHHAGGRTQAGTPDELAADYELSLAQVYAALAYYYAHKSELDLDIRVQIDKARALKEQAVGRSSTLLSR